MMDYKNTIARILHLLMIITQITAVRYEDGTIETSIQDDEFSDGITDPTSSSTLPFDDNSNRREFVEVRRIQEPLIFSRSRRWSPRRKPFTAWTAWSACDSYCKQKRERYCRLPGKCGRMKQMEERGCSEAYCVPKQRSHFSSPHFISNIDDEDDDDRDYFIVKKRPKLRPKKKKITIELDDYDDEMNYEHSVDEAYTPPHIPFKKRNRLAKQRLRTRYLRGRRRGRRKPKYRLRKKLIWDRKFGDSDDVVDDYADESDDFVDNDSGEEVLLQTKDHNSMRLDGNVPQHSLDRNYGTMFENANAHTLAGRTNRRIPGEYFNSDRDDYVQFNQNTEMYMRSENINFDDNSNRRWDTSVTEEYSGRQLKPPTISFDGDRDNKTSTTIARRADVNVGKVEGRKYGKEKAVFDMPGRFRRIYSKWSKWSKCSAKCTTRRFKRCKAKDICGNEVIREVAYCYTEGSFCQTWINSQPPNQKPVTSTFVAQKPIRNKVQPNVFQKRDPPMSNAINGNLFYNSRSYKPPAYVPQNLQCGFPAVRNKPKHYLWGMLRIIGGKTARKGQWPWQAAILNRFKEAFCGGTLVSPLWVLTAAHCVRKKLFIRLGEHNLEVIEGSEIEFRVDLAIKHPKYDKRTVDNDVAMLRLPQEVSPSTYIGYACLPLSYQQLPKTHQCTIIGWGKRRNTDEAGTSLLHEAEVPIISNEDCKQVYFDYTITKNMFCAGHKRGRIDTCAGDSGGPILCRDTTIPNQPWTIFGITSFGDGCGKRNKFGIYAKVPNYVDWIWSVINCNGNCNATYSNFLNI